jgi:branched-subunit amino acid transport protein
VTASSSWTLIGLCAVVTATIKAAGPVALGGRELPAWFTEIVTLLAPALLSGLVCVAVFSHGRALDVGAQTAGVAVAGVVLARGGSIVVGMVVAAAVTALLRI